MQDYEIAARDFAAKLESLGLAVACQFVPFSASRNAKEAQPSLNWRCTVTRNGKPIQGLESIDYMQGSGHCPAYRARDRWESEALKKKAIAMECESGQRAMPSHLRSAGVYLTGTRIAPPTAADVISSLCRDSDALEYPVFEDWAADLGFDPDSRKGEATYRACLAIGLALRASIGDPELQALRDLAGQM